MRRRTFACLLPAAFLLGCASSSAETDATVRPASPAIMRLDLFAEAPGPASQLVFVGQQRPAQLAQWPGAVFVPMSTFSVVRNGIPNELPPADSLAALLRTAGVGGGPVLIVGDPIPAGRAYAAFDYLGLGSSAALLDGGPGALPATAVPVARGTQDLGVRVREGMIVDAAWVHSRLDDPGVAILDARPPAEFTGATPGEGVDRPGHIPGARNVFWQTLVRSPQDSRLKPEAELRRILTEAGAAPGDIIVAYCRTGGQASFLYTVARHLGYDVRLYDGSFVDWSRTSYPVER